MNHVDEIKRKIAEKRSEIAEYEQKLFAARNQLEAFEYVLQLDGSPQTQAPTSQKEFNSHFKLGSTMFKIEKFLFDRGRTANIDEITAGIGKPKEKRGSIRASMSNYNDVFFTAERGQYGLLIWK